MANGIRGDISLGKALEMLRAYDPCSTSFAAYEDMDQKLPAYGVWSQADFEDIRWVLDALDLYQLIPALRTFNDERAAADKAKQAVYEPACEECENVFVKAGAITDLEERYRVQREARVVRGNLCDRAYEVWVDAYREAGKRYEREVRSGKTYRIVLAAVKSLSKESSPTADAVGRPSASADEIPF